MATKSKSKKSNTYSKLRKKNAFSFHWWMAVILVVLVAVIGIAIVRLSNASSGTERTITPGATYWLGDSLSLGLGYGGSLAIKLRDSGFDPITMNVDPGRSIRGKGFATKQSGLEAIDTDQAVVKQAKLIVIFLGTNPEDDFAGAQAELLSKIHAINPTAQVLWVDLAGVGDGKTERALTNKTKRAEENKLIYANSSVFAIPYGVISQFKFIWGSNVSPLNLATQTYPDPGQLLSEDGVHYTKTGYEKVADYLVKALLTGNISPPGSLPSNTSATTIALPNTNANYAINQTGESTSNCTVQVGFKTNTDFRACIITSTTPLTVTSNNFLQYTNTAKLKICISALNAGQQPIQIGLNNNGTSKTNVTLTFGTNGLGKLLACGVTTTAPGAFNTVTISSPTKILANQLTVKATP